MSSAQNAALWGVANSQQSQIATNDRLDASKDAALAALGAFQAPQLETLQGGYDAARGSYGKASALFDPYATTGAKGFSGYADAIGANGAEGSDRATAAFRASPGYQWGVDQALDGVARKASATGALGSGNTLAALSDRAGHMADQEYGAYTGNLQTLGQMGLTATGAQSSLEKGVGDLWGQQGRDNASVYANTGNRSAGVITGTATGQAANDVSATNLQSKLALSGGEAADKERDANNPFKLTLGALQGAAGIYKGLK